MRKYLIAVTAAMALAVSAFAASSAMADTLGADDNIDMSFAPQTGGTAQLFTLKATKGGLFLDLSNTFNGGGGGTALNPAKEPLPVIESTITFENTIKLNPTFTAPVKGVACTGLSAASDTTQSAMTKCGGSYLGGGYATLCGSSTGPGGACDLTDTAPGGPANATLSEFYGGKIPAGSVPECTAGLSTVDPNCPTITIFGRADHTPIGPVANLLTAVLDKPKILADKGTQWYGGFHLNTNTSTAAFGGAVAITDFTVNMQDSAAALVIPCPKVTAFDPNLNVRSLNTFFGGAQDAGGTEPVDAEPVACV